MPSIPLSIGGRQYMVTCRDGEEEHLRVIGRLVDDKAAQVRATAGSVNEVRHLLYAALLLADELAGTSQTKPALAEPVIADGIANAFPLVDIAARIEAIADTLEAQAIKH